MDGMIDALTGTIDALKSRIEDTSDWVASLCERIEDLERQRAEDARRLGQMEAMLAPLGGRSLPVDVAEREAEAARAQAIARRIGSWQEIPESRLRLGNEE